MSKYEKSSEIIEVLKDGSVYAKRGLIQEAITDSIPHQELTEILANMTEIEIANRDIAFYICEFIFKARLARSIETLHELNIFALKLAAVSDYLDTISKTPDNGLDESIFLNFIQNSNATEPEKFIKYCNLESSEENTVDVLVKLLGINGKPPFSISKVLHPKCLTEEKIFSIRRILIIFVSTGANINRKRIIGYDLDSMTIIRLTQFKDDERILPNSKFGGLRERTVIRVAIRKIEHKLYFDLHLVDENSVEMIEEMGKKSYVNILKEMAGKHTPNTVFREQNNLFELYTNYDTGGCMVKYLIKKESFDQIISSINLLRIKKARVENYHNNWHCSLFTKDMSKYKPRILDQICIRNLDKSKVYYFNGIALVDFMPPIDVNGQTQINIIRLIGDEATAEALNKPICLAGNIIDSSDGADFNSEIGQSSAFIDCEDYDDYANYLDDDQGVDEDDYGEDSSADAPDYYQDPNSNYVEFEDRSFDKIENEEYAEYELYHDYYEMNAPKELLLDQWNKATAACHILFAD